jgi:hypothetical protein
MSLIRTELLFVAAAVDLFNEPTSLRLRQACILQLFSGEFGSEALQTGIVT